MAKRVFDTIVAFIATLILAPLLIVIALGVRASDKGPILYTAARAGRYGRSFKIQKFRTMRTDSDHRSGITSRSDDRVFPFGAWLRRLKLDELPQLWNVLRGDMSLVGPRPEAMHIVEEHYQVEQMRTLDVLPGLASPGSIYNYTHGERLIGEDDPERDYLLRLLPTKLALELAYVDQASFCYDMKIIGRTITTILRVALGQTEFEYPPEYSLASSMPHFPNAAKSERSTPTIDHLKR